MISNRKNFDVLHTKCLTNNLENLLYRLLKVRDFISVLFDQQTRKDNVREYIGSDRNDQVMIALTQVLGSSCIKRCPP